MIVTKSEQQNRIAELKKNNVQSKQENTRKDVRQAIKRNETICPKR